MQLAVTTLILVHLVQGEISKLSKQQINIINTSASVEKSLSIASVLSVQYSMYSIRNRMSNTEIGRVLRVLFQCYKSYFR